VRLEDKIYYDNRNRNAATLLDVTLSALVPVPGGSPATLNNAIGRLIEK
jgi:hypothetical protein